MQFDARLAGDAAALARAHGTMLARLPATVHAFILVELQKWPTLFAPEQRYQRALLDHLSALTRPDLQQAVAGIARVEAEAGSTRIAGGDPGRFQEDAQALLRKQRLLPAWRKEVDGFFQQVDAALDATTVSPGCSPSTRGPDLWQRHRHPGRQTVEPLQGDRHSSASTAGGHAGIRRISQDAVWRARQWRHGAGAVCGSHGVSGAGSAGCLDHRVSRSAA